MTAKVNRNANDEWAREAFKRGYAFMALNEYQKAITATTIPIASCITDRDFVNYSRAVVDDARQAWWDIEVPARLALALYRGDDFGALRWGEQLALHRRRAR